MSEIPKASRAPLAVISCFLLAACSALDRPTASPDRTKRIPLESGGERVIMYEYPTDQRRTIITHVEDNSGPLDAISSDQYYYQYCGVPEGSDPGAPASALFSEYRKTQLPKFGGSRVMRQVMPIAPECVDGVVNQEDQNIDPASPIPPAGEPKDIGSVNNWHLPK